VNTGAETCARYVFKEATRFATIVPPAPENGAWPGGSLLRPDLWPLLYFEYGIASLEDAVNRHVPTEKLRSIRRLFLVMYVPPSRRITYAESGEEFAFRQAFRDLWEAFIVQTHRYFSRAAPANAAEIEKWVTAHYSSLHAAETRILTEVIDRFSTDSVSAHSTIAALTMQQLRDATDFKVEDYLEKDVPLVNEMRKRSLSTITSSATRHDRGFGHRGGYNRGRGRQLGHERKCSYCLEPLGTMSYQYHNARCRNPPDSHTNATGKTSKPDDQPPPDPQLEPDRARGRGRGRGRV
jgi:hypothetical protein